MNEIYKKLNKSKALQHYKHLKVLIIKVLIIKVIMLKSKDLFFHFIASITAFLLLMECLAFRQH